MIKCFAVISTHGDRIRKIDNCNATPVCPACFENENWDHVITCFKNKDNREEW